jgi:Tfp pilus assembly protein PilX
MSITSRIRDERGVTIVVALLVLVIVMLLTAVVVSATIDLSVSSRRDTAEKRAFEAAQAGLQQTLYRLNMQINTQPTTTGPSQLLNQCIGGSGEGIMNPSIAGSVCAPSAQDLGNNAYYVSWTSIAFTNPTVNVQCAGLSTPPTQYIGERCITSEGIICPAAYTGGVIGLTLNLPTPCAGAVMHRVEERVSANLGQSQILFSGLTGTNGVSILGSPNIQGIPATNGELWLKNNSQISSPEQLGLGGLMPEIDNNNGKLGTCIGPQTTWPSTCVNQLTTQFQLPAPQFPSVACQSGGTCDDMTNPYQQPDGDALISNAFRPCGQPGAQNVCPHDSFAGCSTTPQTGTPVYPNSCGWDPRYRTLNPPNNSTWTLYGGTYELCNLSLTQATAKLGGTATAIYIDSPLRFGSACPNGTGHFAMSSGGQILNPSTNSLNLILNIFGTSSRSSELRITNYANNDCMANGQTHIGSDCVQVTQGSQFYGVIDAPTSDVYIANGGNNVVGTTGSVQARTVTYGNNSAFSGDLNDKKIQTYALGVYYRTEWHDCAIEAPNASDPVSGC